MRLSPSVRDVVVNHVTHIFARTSIPTIVLLMLIAANATSLARLAVSSGPQAQKDELLVQLQSKLSVEGVPVNMAPDRAALVLFIGKEWEEAVRAALLAIREARLTNPVNIVAVVALPSSPLRSLAAHATIVAVDEMRGLGEFGASASWNTWRVYDADGVRRASGSLLNSGLIGALSGVVDGNAGSIPREIAVSLNLTLPRERDDEHTIAGVVQREEFVMFVRSASTSCPIATIFAKMQDIAAKSADMNMAVVVPTDWSDTDIDVLRSTFGLTLDVERASQSTSAAWDELDRVYGAAQVNAFLALRTAGQIGAVYSSGAAILRALDDEAK